MMGSDAAPAGRGNAPPKLPGGSGAHPGGTKTASARSSLDWDRPTANSREATSQEARPGAERLGESPPREPLWRAERRRVFANERAHLRKAAPLGAPLPRY